jgi:CBS domain containing-hemolysin-like protein
MIVTKNVLQYVVSYHASLREALEKANRGKIRTLFVVDENEVVHGTLSSGDISRWLIEQDNSEQLNERITSLIDDAQFLEEHSKLARKRIVANCSWQKYSNHLKNYIE